MSVTADLYRLEQVDSELERRKAELSDLRHREARNPELQAAEARLVDIRAQEQEATLEQRALEAELADVEARQSRTQRRIYDGRVVDSREIATLQREGEHLRLQRSDLEDRVLLAMERLEGLQDALARANGTAMESRRRWEEERPRLAEKVRETAQSLVRLQEERASLAASIDPRSLSMYERLRASSGHAVATITDGVCQWCRVMLLAKDIQHARSGALVVCGNCGRILYGGR